MTLKGAMKRIEELERRVKELEARPPETHTHYHAAPVQQPTYYQPLFQPLPPRWPYEVTCGVAFNSGPKYTAAASFVNDSKTFTIGGGSSN